MGTYDWQILEEHAYTNECWNKITETRQDSSLRPLGSACSYKTVPIDKLIWSGLEDIAPDVVEMLKKLNVGLEALDNVTVWAAENVYLGDYRKAAAYYLQTYEEAWRAWVAPEAYQKIKRALP